MLVHESAAVADRVKDSVLRIAGQYGVDPRVILAIIMAESRGDVGVGAAWDGQPTYGIMQAYGCPSFPGNHDVAQV